jgi:hypothetical protein
MSIWSNVKSTSEVPLLVFCLDELSVGDSGVFSSPTITLYKLMGLPVPFSQLEFFFNVHGCQYVWCIYVKNWCFLLMNFSFKMKWPLLCLLADFSLMSTLSDASVATSAYIWSSFPWKTFFHPSTLSQCLFFSVRWVPCKQHKFGSYFFTQFDILCLLIGALRPFTFNVNIERCLLFPMIFVSPFCTFTYSLVTILLGQKGLYFLESSCFTLVSSSVSIFCSAGLGVMNSFSFSLLWKVLIFPSIRKDSFAGLTSLGWQILSFRVDRYFLSELELCFFHDLLTFRV